MTKAIPKLNKNDIIHVRWHDAAGFRVWVNSGELEKLKPNEVQTVGFFHGKDKDAFRLMGTFDNQGNIHDTNCIPRSNIVEVQILRKAKR